MEPVRVYFLFPDDAAALGALTFGIAARCKLARPAFLMFAFAGPPVRLCFCPPALPGASERAVLSVRGCLGESVLACVRGPDRPGESERICLLDPG